MQPGKHHPQTPNPEKQNLKYAHIVDTMISKVIYDLHFSLNYDCCIVVSKNIIKPS